jgi:hypothetical protein
MTTAKAIERNSAERDKVCIVSVEVGEYTATLKGETKGTGPGRHYRECLDRDAHSEWRSELGERQKLSDPAHARPRWQ